MGSEKKCPKCKLVLPAEMRFCGACGTHLNATASTLMDKDPLIGTLVGNRFIILEKIGQGGMGVVYRAEQTAIWRPVALKVLRPKFSRDKKLLERFRNEASTASRLSHPNTITIYDFGVLEDKGLYIAMEFIEGTSLDDEIDQHGALDWQRTARIAIQICGSLEEAHAHNIIHRDLKPENIMLTHRPGASDVVKVLDFGIAKIMAEEGAEHRPALTARDEIFGTPEYMAPEQIRGETLDRRTDVYALGVILYRMVTGSLPFSGDAPMAVLAKHLMESPLPIESHAAGAEIPLEIRSLIMASIEKKPEDRPDSMAIISEKIKKSTISIVRKSGRPKADAPAAPAPTAKPEREDLHEKDKTLTQSTEPEVTAVETALAGTVAIPVPAKKEEKKARPVDERAHDPDQPIPDADEEVSVGKEAEEKGLSRKEATIQAMIEKMKKSRDFPATSHTITELNSKASRQDTSARQLANVILRDYGLTNKLLKLVNSPYYGQYRGRVMTISRAVVILGFEQVRQTALGLLLVEHLAGKNKGQARALQDTALSSLMSGLIAKNMAKKTGIVDEEEALVCAMFHKLGKYLAIYYFPKEARRIQRLVKDKGESEDNAATRVLGISYTALGQAIAERWEFPDQIRNAMRPLLGGKVAKAKNPQDKLRHLAGFADELTHIAGTTKPARRKVLLQQLAHRFEDNFHLKDGKIDDLVKDATKEVRSYTKVLSLSMETSPFVRRVLRWSGLSDIPPPPGGKLKPISEIPEWESMEPPPPVEEKARPIELDDRKQILINGTEEVAMAMAGTYDLNSLIMMVTETMYRGLGLSRVIFCLHDVKSGILMARSGFGDQVDDMIPKFRFRPRRGRDFFNHAVIKGVDVIVSDTSDPRHTNRLPSWYRRIANPPILLLYPVMIRNFPAGLFYGDMLDPKQTLNRGLLVHMDKLRNKTTRALKEKRITG
ncbi:MAG: HDOD domain-containing protein [Myxococcota bacterium]|nr:HDOD domain-containing protein [Myxococcota bacterium]